MSLRDLSELNGKFFDAVVLGGGVQGVCIALYLAASGLRPILLEKSDFGCGATANSLRILHGGLRYLQTMDLPRFFSSVSARRWFFRNFPDLVAPLRCAMPLTRKGMRRSSLMRPALLINDVLSMARNSGVPDAVSLPASGIIGIGDLGDLGIELDAYSGHPVAVWYDGTMEDSARLMMELLRWSDAHGAIHLNYAEPDRLITSRACVTGVVFRDLLEKTEIELKTNLVFNATGAAVTETLTDFGVADAPDLPHLLAWNILVDRSAPDGTAVAVTPDKAGAQTYFMRPWKGRWLIGTGQAASESSADRVSERHIEGMLADINSALPSIKIRGDEVLRVYSGRLPSTAPKEARLRKWPRIIQHGADDGTKGLVSVSSVKYTTSVKVAQKSIERVLGSVKFELSARPEPAELTKLTAPWQFDHWPTMNEIESAGDWKSIAADESIWFIEDLLLRRTSIGDNAGRAWKMAPILMTEMGWSKERQEENLSRLNRSFEGTVPGWVKPDVDGTSDQAGQPDSAANI